MDPQRDDGETPDKNCRPEAQKKPVSKKRYATPVLVEYGTIAKLTQGTKTKNADTGGGNKKVKNCL